MRIWVTSPCPVGIQVAADLLRRTSVRLSAPPHLHEDVRSAVASCLGYAPGERLELQDGCHGVSEVWHLTQLDETDRDDLAGIAREAGVVYRRFEIGPTASGPEAPVPDAFGVLLQALDQTLEEVRARSPEYFEQRALRTSLPEDVALLSPRRAALAVIALSAAPPGCHRIVAAPDAGRDSLGELIGEAYDVELLFGADASSLSAVDRLFESRFGTVRQSLSAAAAGAGPEAGSPEAASTAETAACLSAWSRFHAASHRAERARLASFPGAEARRVLSRSDGLEYHLFGDAGPTVVIVNAIGMGLLYWGRLIDRLAHDHRVVIWQLRTMNGHSQVATLADHVGDLEAIVEEVAEGRPIHLVGWCSGPKLCLRYAIAHPNRVASMVFLAGTYGDPSSETGYQKKLGVVFELLERSPGMAATVRGMLTDSASLAAGLSEQADGFAEEPEVLARADPSLQVPLIAPYRSDESTLAYAKQIRDFWSCPFDAEALAVSTPTLIVGAELDRIASPKLGLEVAQALTGARFIEMPGATHYCMYDRPDEVAALIRNFFRE